MIKKSLIAFTIVLALSATLPSAFASTAPTADPDGPYSVSEQENIQLDGTGSSDPDGHIENYLWAIDSGPGSLVDENTPTPTYIAPSVDSDTDVYIKLTVTDNAGDTDEAIASLTVTNEPLPLENRLLENFLKLRENYRDFRRNVQENYVRIENYERLQSKYENLKADFENFKSTYYSSVASIEDDLSKIREKWSTLVERVRRNAENISSLLPKISVLNKKVRRLKKRIGNIGKIKKRASSLEDKVKVLNKKIKGVKSDLSDLSGAKKKVSKLAKRISAVESKVKNAEKKLSDLKKSTRKDIKKAKEDFKKFKEDVKGKFSTLENELSGELSRKVKSAKNRLVSRIENSRRKLDGVIAKWDNVKGNLENKIRNVKTTAMTARRNLSERLDKEENENPWWPGFACSLGILALILVGIVAYARKNDFFKQLVPREKRSPELQIWAALNKLDHYYEQVEKYGAEQFRPLIEGQKETIRALRDRWPEKYEKVVRNEDVSGLKEREETEEEEDVRASGHEEGR